MRSLKRNRSCPARKRRALQAEMNQCASRAYEQADAELSSAYRQLTTTLAKSGEQHVQKTEEAQEAWTKYREATCASETALNEGGTMLSMALNYCLASVTKERTQRLKEMAKMMERSESSSKVSPKKDAAAMSKPIVAGTVFYLERIALPPNAVVKVKLVDVSRQDVVEVVVAEQTINKAGQQVPIPFEVNYDPQSIDPKHTYAIRASIIVGGELWFMNTTAYHVITRDNPRQVKVRVNRVTRQ
ncbi:MAG: YbaY family lipoprotein [Pyrinomonadaceae bacterium]